MLSFCLRGEDSEVVSVHERRFSVTTMDASARKTILLKVHNCKGAVERDLMQRRYGRDFKSHGLGPA